VQILGYEARTLAEKTARKVPGVKKLINTLGTTTGQWLEEEVRINDTLRLNGFENVSARVIGSDAYVSGQVSSAAEKQRAARVISSISKLGVVNFIRVVPRGGIF
jgi:osmotically-inducible protein OsmY